jgi:hypothetical protein
MRCTSSTRSSKRLSRSSLAAAALSIIGPAGCASQPGPSSSVTSNPVITRLVSRHEVITITAGPGAPLYTVADPSGRVLVSGMTLHDLKTTDPELYERLAPALAPEADASAGE